MKSTIYKLNYLLTKRDKQYLFGLLLFSIFISLIETIGIGVIMPFISVASDFETIHQNTPPKLNSKFDVLSPSFGLTAREKINCSGPTGENHSITAPLPALLILSNLS